jgi:predicted MFS family arabinose efflux permease
MVGASTPSRLALNPGIINGGVSIIAVGIGPALVVNIALASTWRMGFVVAGVISIIVSLCLIKVLRNDNHIPEEKKKESMFKIIGRLLRVRNVVLSFFLGIMIMVVYWTQMLYATLFFSTVGGQDMASAGAIVSFMGIAGVAWTIVVPKLSDLIGRRPASIIWFAVCAIAPYAMFGAPSSTAAMVLYIIFAAIPGSLFPMFQAVIPGESLPNYMLGTAIGMILGVAEIVGGSIWPAVAGFVADAYGYPTVILAAGIAGTIGLIVALFLKETKGKGVDAQTL